MLLGQGPGRPRRPQLSMAMTDPEPIEYIAYHLGGYLRDMPADPSANRQAQRRWRANGSQAIAAAQAILPYIVMPRRRAVLEALVEGYPARDHRDIPDKDAIRRRHELIDALWEDMRRLNGTRGQYIELAPQKPTPEDFAYAAGILDGEGHITRSSQVQVTSTDPELISWLASRFGGRVYERPRRSERHRHQWAWYLSRGRGGSEFLGGVSRYLLVPRKRQQASAHANCPYGQYLPGTALEVAEASGDSYRSVDKKLRAAAERGRLVRSRRPPGRAGGRPSWEYRQP